MQAQPNDRTFDSFVDIVAEPTIEPTTKFHTIFVDCMEMYADAAMVARYLDNHSEWFRRCAQPMKADPIGNTGYILTIGNYGALGYEIEPKIGLDLLPQQESVYRIETIPVPGFVAPGYDVDFRASMELVEHEPTEEDGLDNGAKITRVQWHLDLTVQIQFPKFIQALPKSLIQATGERLLDQIIRQVSRRLTHKVQTDFHSTYNLTIPKTQRRWFFQ
ncbi:DUF1997 domain-containing protein [Alkalinema sp. FACHB-956]|uniref:DUF1997 domain-containing protein n=1 Tax=Alkalinema sp. FACHB-956 TaxID=2692768 RepID=UPI0016822C82|nr:DUF1997 domain-containing protein [Alkalinema sp. FACHB-956]MBD2325592.1 DUF1997 domain-containing protein [Alkalinema sp. FACHB-956]